MRSKWNKTGRRYMATLLALLMVWSLMPGNSFSSLASAASMVSGREATPSDASEATEDTELDEDELDEFADGDLVNDLASPSDAEELDEEELLDGTLEATPSNAAKEKAFEQSQTIDSITVRVTADKGVFPEDAKLHVELVEDTQLQEQIQTAVEETTGAKDDPKKTVEKTMAFDITILDSEGNELQPDTEQGQVKVSFEKVDTANVEAGKSTLEVFHLSEDNTQAEKLDAEVDVDAKTVEVQAEHFSTYVWAEISTLAEGDVASVKVGETITTYPTINQAWDAANAVKGASTITLLQDVKTDATITIPTGINITLDLNGCTIDRGLNAPENPGYVISNQGTLTIQDNSSNKTGTITGGNATDSAGGIYNDGILTIEGGIITGNHIERNGGGGITNCGTLTISGGKITGNTTGNGGTNFCTGIYNGGGILTIENGTLQDDLYVTDNTIGSIELKGGSFSKIYTSFDTTMGSLLGNGYVYKDSNGAYITDTAILDGKSIENVTVAAAPVTITEQPKNVVLSETLSVVAKKADGTTDGIDYQWYQKGADGADDTAVGEKTNIFIPTEGGSYYCAVTCGEYMVKTTTVYVGVAVAEVTIDGENQKYSTFNEALTAATTAGTATITLLQDVKTNASITIPVGKTITLDLNGYKIDRGLKSTDFEFDGNVIINNGTLTIQDNGNNGTITGGFSEDGGGGIYNYGGTLKIEGGSITGNSAKDHYGGGIYNSGDLTITGGEITGNQGRDGSDDLYINTYTAGRTYAFSGGAFGKITMSGDNSKTVADLLIAGYGYKNADGSWVTNTSVTQLSDVTVAAPIEPIEPLLVEGVYQIENVGNLEWFAIHVNGGETSANAALTADLELGNAFSRIGTETNPYIGTFDGGGHTVTVNYTGIAHKFVGGLFDYVGSTTIKNLTVTGSISTSSTHVGGVVSYAKGSSATVTFENVFSSVDITSTASGDNTSGGIAACLDGTTTMTNCAYTGTISNQSGTNCGGLLGYSGKGVTFENCYMAGTMALSKNDGSATFSRGDNVTCTNCYYLNAYGIVHGTEKTTEDFTGGAVAWLLNDESAANPVWYQNLDSGTPDSTPVLDSTHGVVYKTKAGTYFNTYPIEKSPTISLAELTGTFVLKTENSKTYYSMDGGTEWLEYTGSVTLTESTTTNTVTVQSGTHAVTLNEASIEATAGSAFVIAAGATANLTLAGENKASALHGSDYLNNAGVQVPGGAVLTITAESTGSLIAEGGFSSAGIGGGRAGTCGIINIEGGTVNASAVSGGAGIGSGYWSAGGTITISGGNVNASSTDHGAGIGDGDTSAGCTVTISGGNVKAISTYAGENMDPITGTVTDGKGHKVVLTEVTLEGIAASQEVKTLGLTGSTAYGITGMTTLDTNKLYLYLPENTGISSVTLADDTRKVGYVAAGGSGTLGDKYQPVYTAPANCVYTGQAIVPTVSWGMSAAEATELGLLDITVKYKLAGQEDFLGTAPVDCGSYEVYASAEASTVSDAVTNKLVGSYTIYKELMKDAEGRYELYTAADMLALSVIVDNGEATANAILMADVDLDNSFPRIGRTEAAPFSGTFDGDFHTVTVAYTDVSKERTGGVFDELKDATIQNLTVKGSISGTAKRLGGVAGHATSTSNSKTSFRNVLSAVTITTSATGDNTNGGILSGGDGSVELYGCGFVGEITATAGTNCGGLIGWSDGSAAFTRCYMAGTMTLSAEDESNTFARGRASIYNDCYYKTSYGTTTEYATQKSEAEFQDGAVAYWLNDKLATAQNENPLVWYQNLDNGETKDAYPVIDPEHGTVYQVQEGETYCYTNIDPDAAATNSVKGHSLTLDGTIGVNFFLELTGLTLADKKAVVRFTLPNGKKEDIKVNDVKPDTTTVAGEAYYMFTAHVAAKEMADTITLELLDGSGKELLEKAYEYSVKKYADDMMAHPEETGYQNAAGIVKAMLNYGSYAQIYFEHNADSLANAGLTDNADPLAGITAETLSGFAITEGLSNELVTLGSTNLVLESETTLRFHFTVHADNELTYTLDGKEVTPKISSSGATVSVENINSLNLDKYYTVNVSDGSASYDMSYCPMTYVYNVLSRDTTATRTEKLKDLMKALCLYNDESKKYKEN